MPENGGNNRTTNTNKTETDLTSPSLDDVQVAPHPATGEGGRERFAQQESWQGERFWDPTVTTASGVNPIKMLSGFRTKHHNSLAVYTFS